MSGIWQDVRYAARSLSNMRGPAMLAVLMLALGIGATTTMFSVVYAALLRPVPFDDPDRVVVLYLTRTTAQAHDDRVRFSHAELAALTSSATSFESTASFSRTSLAAELPEPEQIDGEVVSARYFETLRVGAAIGRVFSAEEDAEPGAHPVVLVSDRLWRTRLSGDSGVLGRSLAINGVPLTIIGVMPEGFAGASGRAEVWIPTAMAPRLTYAEYLTTPQHFLPAIARLKSGVSLAAANAELAVIGSAAATVDSSAGDTPATWSATAVVIGDARIDPAERRSALLLLVAIVCVLLIACANVASLLMARLRQRRREIAVRRALGADTWRVGRQLLTESLVLAAAGGAVGTLLAVWGLRLVALAAPSTLPSTQTGYAQVSGFAAPGFDVVVLAFAIGATVVTSVLFGAAPAIEAVRGRLVPALREDDRTTAAGRSRVLSSIVVVEIAVAVILMAAASLFVASFVNMQRLRDGVVPQGVLTFRVVPPVSRYTPEQGPAIIERLLTQIQQTPGVTLAAVNRCTPLNMSCARTTLFFPGQPPPARPPVVERHYISADYFPVLGVSVKRGRGLAVTDRQGRPPVTVINERAAAQFWPGEDPVGKHVWFGSATGFTDPANPVEVVGVVGDVKYGAVDDPPGADFYTSYLQFAYPDTMVLVKSDRVEAGALVKSMREAVAAVDRGLPIHDVMTLDDRMDEAMNRPRFHATMLTVFAGAALVLAAVGVYGVMSFVVSARTHEIGIRVALGADAGRVMALVLGQSAKLAIVGAASGIAIALVLTRIVRGWLFEVTPDDPRLMTIAAGVLILAALAAAAIPARRATRVDPIVALRNS